MNIKSVTALAGCVLGGFVAIVCRSSYAVLGGSVGSIEGDRKALSALRHNTTIRPAFSIHELEWNSTVIREYVSPQKKVFGVAWEGLVHPDLVTLLGSYTEDFEKAARENPKSPGHRRYTVQARNLVVQKWGHMRQLRGRAYDPHLLPEGVSPDDIK